MAIWGEHLKPYSKADGPKTMITEQCPGNAMQQLMQNDSSKYNSDNNKRIPGESIPEGLKVEHIRPENKKQDNE